jgi:hypothetical protein
MQYIGANIIAGVDEIIRVMLSNAEKNFILDKSFISAPPPP